MKSASTLADYCRAFDIFTDVFETAEQAVAMLQDKAVRYDLIVIEPDGMLGMGGYAFCSWFRQNEATLPGSQPGASPREVREVRAASEGAHVDEVYKLSSFGQMRVASGAVLTLPLRFALEPVVVNESANHHPMPSPDGRKLLYMRERGDLHLLDLATGGSGDGVAEGDRGTAGVHTRVDKDLGRCGWWHPEQRRGARGGDALAHGGHHRVGRREGRQIGRGDRPHLRGGQRAELG